MTLSTEQSATSSRHTGSIIPNFDITLGKKFDHFGALLHLGYHDGQPHIQSALLYRDRDHHDDYHYDHYGYNQYDYGHYYHHYSPFYTHYDYGHQYPWYGYSYSSVYYQQPVVYRFYNTETIYVDDINDRVVRYTDSSYGDDVYDSTLVGPPAPRTGTANIRNGASNTMLDYAVIEDQANPDESGLNSHPVERGSIAYARGDYEEANKLFAQAMLSDERDGYVKLLYAMTGFATGEYELAAVALRRALLTTDLLIDRPLDVRTLYQDLHKFDVQIDRLKHYVADHPKDRQSRFLLGYINYATGRQEPAVVLFGTLATENHEDILVHKLLKAAALSKLNIPSS